MGVRLTIDELVLNGFDRRAGERVALSFQRELTRLLREQPPAVPEADREIDVARGVSAHARTPRRIGIELARAVHTSLTDSGERP
ncbi:hypothetical protein [Flindersiella endophytica]